MGFRGIAIVGLSASTALLAGAIRLAPPAEQDTFKTAVMPFIEKQCLPCHNGDRAKGGLDLSSVKSSAALSRDPELTEKLLTFVRARFMPPESAPQPSDKERSDFIGAIEALLAVDCRLADAGRVTLRRLNRAEYDNTTRDLLGIDLKLAEDFPSDDVGYGFDNIGDVLSVSPLLFEKYLTAAERLAAAAMPGWRVPSKTYISSQFKGMETVRNIDDAMLFFANGVATVSHTFPNSGNYKLKFTLAGMQAGPDVVRAKVGIDKVTFQDIEVKATQSKPAEYEIPVTVPKGPQTIFVAFVNDFYEPNNPDEKKRDRNMLLYEVQVTGPIGQRPPPTDSQRRLFGDTVIAGRERSAAREILGKLADRAYRRPSTETEKDRLQALYDVARKAGDGFEEGLQVGITAILVSPHFLFRTELDSGEAADAEGNVKINDWALASRLSYFLWSTTPDFELRQLAAAGKLSDQKVLNEQVMRLLQSNRASQLTENFVGQWLQLRKLSDLEKDKATFPEYTSELRADFLQETKRFFMAMISEDRPITEIIDAPYTFLNQRLANHYGIRAKLDSDWNKVPLTDGARGGILTQGSFLAVTSNPDRTSPVKRGKFVLENILGATIPPPPPNVGVLADDAKSNASMSLRQKMELHRQKPACIGCHKAMDPIGFSLENFDAIGRWRTRDGEHKLETNGELPDGTKFEGVNGLRTILLKRKDEVTANIAERMLTYALGRGMRRADRCHIDAIVAEVKANQYRFSSLVKAVVNSEPFRYRSAKP